MVRSALVVAALLAGTFAFAGESTSDAHLASGRIGTIVHQSVFFHGYLHGYEEGFHMADLDLQMGRPARDISKCKEAKQAEGYRRQFGDKHFYELGYRQGARVGYADGIARRSFRALSEVDTIGAIVPGDTAAAPDGSFDEAFSVGYVNGQHQGLQDGRNQVSYTAALPACPRAGELNTQSFCAAYVGGFRFGYADGFVNVARPPAVQYEARAGK